MDVASVRVLPPLVCGKLSGTLTVVVDEVFWIKKPAGEIVVELQWWGDKEKCEFRPQDVAQPLKSSNAETSVTFEVRTSPGLFEAYLRNCEKLTLVVRRGKGGSVVGKAVVEDLEQVITSGQGAAYFPIFTSSGSRIGDLHVGFNLVLKRKVAINKVPPSTHTSDKVPVPSLHISNKSTPVTVSTDSREKQVIDEVLEKGRELRRVMVASVLEDWPLTEIESVAATRAPPSRQKSALSKDAKLTDYLLGKELTEEEEALAVDTLRCISPTQSLLDLAKSPRPQHPKTKSVGTGAEEWRRSASSGQSQCSPSLTSSFNSSDKTSEDMRRSVGKENAISVEDDQFWWRLTVDSVVLNPTGMKKMNIPSKPSAHCKTNGRSVEFTVEYADPSLEEIKAGTKKPWNTKMIRHTSQEFKNSEIHFGVSALHKVENVAEELSGLQLKLLWRKSGERVPSVLGTASLPRLKPAFPLCLNLPVLSNLGLPVGSIAIRITQGTDLPEKQRKEESSSSEPISVKPTKPKGRCGKKQDQEGKKLACTLCKSPRVTRAQQGVKTRNDTCLEGSNCETSTMPGIKRQEAHRGQSCAPKPKSLRTIEVTRSPRKKYVDKQYIGRERLRNTRPEDETDSTPEVSHPTTVSKDFDKGDRSSTRAEHIHFQPFESNPRIREAEEKYKTLNEKLSKMESKMAYEIANSDSSSSKVNSLKTPTEDCECQHQYKSSELNFEYLRGKPPLPQKKPPDLVSHEFTISVDQVTGLSLIGEDMDFYVKYVFPAVGSFDQLVADGDKCSTEVSGDARWSAVTWHTLRLRSRLSSSLASLSVSGIPFTLFARLYSPSTMDATIATATLQFTKLFDMEQQFNEQREKCAVQEIFRLPLALVPSNITNKLPSGAGRLFLTVTYRSYVEVLLRPGEEHGRGRHKSSFRDTTCHLDSGGNKSIPLSPIWETSESEGGRVQSFNLEHLQRDQTRDPASIGRQTYYPREKDVEYLGHNKAHLVYPDSRAFLTPSEIHPRVVYSELPPPVTSERPLLASDAPYHYSQNFAHERCVPSRLDNRSDLSSNGFAPMKHPYYGEASEHIFNRTVHSERNRNMNFDHPPKTHIDPDGFYTRKMPSHRFMDCDQIPTSYPSSTNYLDDRPTPVQDYSDHQFPPSLPRARSRTDHSRYCGTEREGPSSSTNIGDHDYIDDAFDSHESLRGGAVNVANSVPNRSNEQFFLDNEPRGNYPGSRIYSKNEMRNNSHNLPPKCPSMNFPAEVNRGEGNKSVYMEDGSSNEPSRVYPLPKDNNGVSRINDTNKIVSRNDSSIEQSRSLELGRDSESQSKVQLKTSVEEEIAGPSRTLLLKKHSDNSKDASMSSIANKTEASKEQSLSRSNREEVERLESVLGPVKTSSNSVKISKPRPKSDKSGTEGSHLPESSSTASRREKRVGAEPDLIDLSDEEDTLRSVSPLDRAGLYDRGTQTSDSVRGEELEVSLNPEELFRAKVEVERVFNLPMIPHPEKGLVKPSTFVCFRAFVDGKETLFKTDIVENDCNPVWNAQWEVFLPIKLLQKCDSRLKFCVREAVLPSCVDSGEASADVDLTALSAGLPLLKGWFFLSNYSRSCGQIKIGITPLEDISKQREVWVKEFSMSRGGGDVGPNCVYLAQALCQAPNQDALYNRVSEILVSPTKPSKESVTTSLLAASLREKLSELESATEILKRRLNGEQEEAKGEREADRAESLRRFEAQLEEAGKVVSNTSFDADLFHKLISPLQDAMTPDSLSTKQLPLLPSLWITSPPSSDEGDITLLEEAGQERESEVTEEDKRKETERRLETAEKSSTSLKNASEEVERLVNEFKKKLLNMNLGEVMESQEVLEDAQSSSE